MSVVVKGNVHARKVTIYRYTTGFHALDTLTFYKSSSVCNFTVSTICGNSKGLKPKLYQAKIYPKALEL